MNIKITFDPEFFEHFDGTQEDLDNLIKEIQKYVENLEFDDEDFIDMNEMEDEELADFENYISSTSITIH